jgi:hypothetical protein
LAKVKPGKSGGKPSITRHPLFPATVALWFGALFGIGSLAIRPSLIEGLIVSMGIDLIIPSAAPPLGATTRILLALGLAALGGTLGAWLARRIARPKPVPVQRKRGAEVASGAAAAGRQNSGVAGSRRSRLALADEGKPRDYVDHAPLPGGANILDVSQFDLDGFEADEPERIEPIEPVQEIRPEPVSEFEQWSPEPEPAPQPEARHVPQGAQVFQPVATEPAVVPEETKAPETSREPVQTFVRDDTQVFAGPAVTDDEPAPFAPPADRAPFAPPHSPAPFAAPEDRAPFAAPEYRELEPSEEAPVHAQQAEPASSPDEETMEPLARLGGETEDRFALLPPKVRPGSIFDQKPASGLFTQPLSTQVSHFGWDNGLPRQSVAAQPAAVSEPPAASEPIAAPAEAVSAPVEQVEAEPPVAAARIAGAPLDDLSHVELLERLALSMRRKRAEAPLAKPLQPEIPVASSEPETNIAEESLAATAPPPIPVIPAPLRPIGLDEDEDGDLLPAYVPPRHFGQAQNVHVSMPAAIAEQTVPAAEAQVHATNAEPAALGEAAELEQGYSSLLSLSRPASGQQRFVRIEEPANPSGEIEPVVVFPGKEPVSGGEGPFARPSSVSSGQAGERALQDPEETDRALRTALANIQRMSGAA